MHLATVNRPLVARLEACIQCGVNDEPKFLQQHSLQLLFSLSIDTDASGQHVMQQCDTLIIIGNKSIGLNCEEPEILASKREI